MCLSRLTDSNLADCSTAERVESRAGRGRPVVTQGNNDILYRPETKKKYTGFFLFLWQRIDEIHLLKQSGPSVAPDLTR